MISFIPTPIGNPQDITIRALRLFESAELFLCEDTRETKRLLRILGERFDFSMPDVEFLSFNEHNGERRLEELADILSQRKVVFVSDAGMPIISDPGQILVEYCQKNSIEYDVLAGASAVVTAYASSGFEEGKFLFFGFLPHKGVERSRGLGEALSCGYNTTLYESPHRLMKLLEEIVDIEPTRELFLAKELTKRYQKYHRGEAKELQGILSNETIRGEWVVIIRAKPIDRPSLYMEDILALDLAPKPKSKLLAKLTGRPIKECYAQLMKK
jgi:16S rRNA (cytidine1402-2'-O)-methyltransferase